MNIEPTHGAHMRHLIIIAAIILVAITVHAEPDSHWANKRAARAAQAALIDIDSTKPLTTMHSVTGRRFLTAEERRAERLKWKEGLLKVRVRVYEVKLTPKIAGTGPIGYTTVVTRKNGTPFEDLTPIQRAALKATWETALPTMTVTVEQVREQAEPSTPQEPEE